MQPAIKLDITQPCNQNWEQMSPSHEGRYCVSCQKSVVDFSSMSDKDIFQYMQQATHAVCGRFNDDQLQKVLKPVANGSPVPYRKNIWQLIMAGTLFAQQVSSQVTPMPSSPITHAVPLQDTVALDADQYQVIDGSNKQPLTGATIMADSILMTTGVNGLFEYNATHVKIAISYIGYETREFLSTNGSLPKRIELERKSDVLAEVSITASGNIRYQRTVGMVSAAQVIKPFQSLVRELKQWMPDQAVKVFPNPVTRGQPLNLQFSLSKPGNYKLSIFSSDGRLVHMQALQITSAKQPFQLPTSPVYSSGVYWLQVQSIGEKQKVHEIKFVVK
jgi:hypothetical protein